MPRFLLIDHSLEALGSHHFNYAEPVLRAAEAYGFNVHLATSHRFSPPDELPAQWRIWPEFKKNMYALEAIVRPPDGSEAIVQRRAAEMATRADFSAFARWNRWRRRRRQRHRQQRVIQKFTHSVAQLLSRLKLGPVDQVFLAAASELDLIGLADFLYSADLPNVDWHVQFHFDFGDSEDQQVEIRRRLLDAREKLQQHRVFMYTTTPELAKIYNTLDVGRFHPLPYPLHENYLRPPVHRDDQWPRRILCAGDTRPEKGLHHLAPITDQILDLLRDGQIQFVIQVGRANAEHWQSVAERLPPGSFQLVPHPLSIADYCELVRSSHIGLLLYDPASYVHRRAGILCEFLVSGVPVVVPDDCWLAGQLTAPVGLAAQGIDDFAQKLRNLVQNYDQFAEVAKSFAGPYSVEFHAARTLEVLLDTATGQTPSFAASLPSCGRHEVH